MPECDPRGLSLGLLVQLLTTEDNNTLTVGPAMRDRARHRVNGAHVDVNAQSQQTRDATHASSARDGDVTEHVDTTHHR